MKKILVITALFIMTLSSVFAQSIDGALNLTDPTGMKTGFWEEKAGDFVIKGVYTKNRKTGNWITYNITNNQIVKLESFNAEGKKDGISLTFDKKNRLQIIEYFRDGFYDGVNVTFSPSTDFPASEVSYSNGKKNGTSKIYYDNGKLQEEDTYLNDIKNGISRWYNRSGKLLAEYNYQMGVFEGAQKTYYENDSVQSYSAYSNNIYNGDYKEFFRNGVVKVSGKYVNGVKEGTWTEFDETGRALNTKKYKNGVAK